MWTERKAKVLGAVERGGSIHATVIPDRSAETIMPILRPKILPASAIYTDAWKSYRGLGREGYEHKRVITPQNVYVSGDAHLNTVEGFWALLKGGPATSGRPPPCREPRRSRTASLSTSHPAPSSMSETIAAALSAAIQYPRLPQG
jgi:hypothetical protein